MLLLIYFFRFSSTRGKWFIFHQNSQTSKKSSIMTNKASGGDGIPVEWFQILKMLLWKCCTQYATKSGKLSNGHRTGKGQFSFQSQRKAMSKNAQTITQLHSSHMLTKVMLKILQARLPQYVNFQMFQVLSNFQYGNFQMFKLV